MSLERAHEVLGEAVQALCTGEGDAKSRVLVAAGSLALVPGDSLPADLKTEYEEIWAAMTARPSGFEGKPWDQGAVAATVGHMKNATASKIAQRIFSLDEKVRALLE